MFDTLNNKLMCAVAVNVLSLVIMFENFKKIFNNLNNKQLYTAIAGNVLSLVMLFLSYYSGYIEFEKADSYIYLWYTYVNINWMRIFLNPWYIIICYILIINIIIFNFCYQQGEYIVGNYKIKLNKISYIVINTVLSWCILPFYIINKVYTPITRRFYIIPTIVNPVILQRETIVNPVIPQRIIGNDNNFQSERPDDCSICHQNLNELDSKTSCGHYFHHRTCLIKWLIISRTTRCPICRSELELSTEELTEIMNDHFLQHEPMYNRNDMENDEPRYNNNIFDNIINYIHTFSPRFNYNNIRDLTE